MKLAIKFGDKVRVLTGKFCGKEDTVAFIDKKSNRVRLTGLKKSKGKKGGKENHGTFHVRSIKVLSKPAPATAASAPQEAPAQAAS